MEIPATYFVVHKLWLDEILLFDRFALDGLNLSHNLLFSKNLNPIYIFKPRMTLNLCGALDS